MSVQSRSFYSDSQMSRPSKPIVSLLPSATEIVCGLGLQEQVVGISHECNWPPGIEGKPRVTLSNVDSSASSMQIDGQVKTLLQAGQALYGVDAELLVSLEPEIIITQAQCDVCAVSYKSVLDIVANHGALNSVQVIALNPTSLDEVLEDIRRIGAATQTTVASQGYVADLQQRINTVVAQTQSHKRRPRTLVIEWTEPLMVAGNWTPQLVELAGGEYGLADAGQPSRYVTWDEIASFAPEVLFVAPCGFDLERAIAELQQLATCSHWNSLPAVRSEHVYPVDGDAFFNRPGPRLVESLEMLASWLQTA